MTNVNQIYNSFTIENESDHIKAMWESLNRAAHAGFCQYEVIENGDGYIHTYTFTKGEEPTFNVISNDIFNQIRIETRRLRASDIKPVTKEQLEAIREKVKEVKELVKRARRYGQDELAKLIEQCDKLIAEGYYINKIGQQGNNVPDQVLFFKEAFTHIKNGTTPKESKIKFPPKLDEVWDYWLPVHVNRLLKALKKRLRDDSKLTPEDIDFYASNYENYQMLIKQNKKIKTICISQNLFVSL